MSQPESPRTFIFVAVFRFGRSFRLLQPNKMASILQASPVHNVGMKDFPWTCRYPRNAWNFGSIRQMAKRSSQVKAPRPVVMCGPSGSGKSTLQQKLMKEYSNVFGFSISHTTRKPRPGEVHGKDYYFVSREEFESSIKNGDFLEYASFSDNLYGTSKNAVKRIQDQGQICILDIEIEGVKNIKKTDLNPHFIFIKPPDVNALEQRLRRRGTECEEDVQKRLSKAKEELSYGETPGNFDLVVVNDNALKAYQQLKSFIQPEIENTHRYQDRGDH